MARPESPLRAEHHELGEFAADLRRLREQAGSPTYRELSRQAHYSPAALSEAANGRKLPSLAVTLAYVRACGGEVAEWEARWRELADQLAGPPRTAPADGRLPYAGLAAFQIGDADRFFGRDRLVRELVELVARRRCTGVFGASGSGKSSVLRAGLAAGASGPVVVLTPGARPVEELAVRVAALTGKPAATLAVEFGAYRENLHLRVRQSLVDGDDDLLLVVDQFEEVFTLCADPAERAAFIAALTTAASAPTSRTRVVLGVRADFLGHCGQYPELVEALRGGHVLVGPMTADELREAVVSPALAVGCKVETALVTRVVSDAAGQPGVLPLVSHALLETWRRRRGLVLTLAAYEEVGGVEHSIARSAEDVYNRLPPDRRQVAKQVFLRLIAIGEGTEDTKRRVTRDEVDHPEVLAALAEARLVVLDRATVELAHEALIRNWPRLRDWIAADRAGLRTQRTLTEAARAWEALDRDPSALYRGTRLALAREWVAGPGRPRLTPVEQRFLEASIAADDAVHAAEHRRTRRLRQLVSVMAVLLLLASGAIVYAVCAKQSAREQAAIALAHKVITQAAALRAEDPALSVQLSLAAHRLAGLPETRDAVFGAFAEPYAARITGARWVAVAPSGSWLVAADGSGTGNARLVDVSDPRRPVPVSELPGVTDVWAAAFAPGGERVALARGNGITVVDVRDLRRPEQEFVLPHPTTAGALRSLAFSPDGRHLAAGYADGPVAAWRFDDPGRPRPLPPIGDGDAHGVAFLRGALLAIAFGDRVRVVDLAGGADGTLVPEAGASTGFAVGEEGRLLAVAGADGVVRLWEVADPLGTARQVGALRHGGEVHALAFDSTGRVLATAGEDRTTRLWSLVDRSAPVEVAALTGHLEPVTSVGFAGGDRVVVTAGADVTARLTDVRDLPVVQPTPIRSVVVAADRGLAATVDVAGLLRLVDISEPRGLRRAWPLTAHRGEVREAALSADGEHLVTVAEDGVVRLWRTSNLAAPDLVGEAGTAVAVAFSPHGPYFATGDDRGRVRLWDARSLVETTLAGDQVAGTNPVNAVAFDGTGGRLVAVRASGWTEEWQLGGLAGPVRRDPPMLTATWVESLAVGAGGELVTLEQNGAVVLWRPPARAAGGNGGQRTEAVPREPLATGARSVAVGGGHAAVAGTDGSLRLFDLGAPGGPRVVAEFAEEAEFAAGAAAFRGRTLVSAGDSELRFWETDPARVEERVCATAHPRITPEQWEAYFPGLSYEPPCGA